MLGGKLLTRKLSLALAASALLACGAEGCNTIDQLSREIPGNESDSEKEREAEAIRVELMKNGGLVKLLKKEHPNVDPALFERFDLVVLDAFEEDAVSIACELRNHDDFAEAQKILLSCIKQVELALVRRRVSR